LEKVTLKGKNFKEDQYRALLTKGVPTQKVPSQQNLRVKIFVEPPRKMQRKKKKRKGTGGLNKGIALTESVGWGGEI